MLCIFLGHANFDDDISTDELYIQCESAYTKVNTRENVGGRRNLWPRTWRKGRVGSIIQGLSNTVMLFSFGERTQLGGWGAISKENNITSNSKAWKGAFTNYVNRVGVGGSLKNVHVGSQGEGGGFCKCSCSFKL